LLHKNIQNSLLHGDSKKNARLLLETWQRFCQFYKLANIAYWSIPGAIATSTIEKKIEKELGKFKVLKTEERLSEPIEKFPQIFKGFIDIILEQKDKIIIADFKTCSSIYMFKKYKDKYKDYQLTLYKHFYCQKHNMDPKNVETYFIPVERNRRSKRPVSLLRVTSGPKKVKNALAWLYEPLNNVKKEGRWIKNRAACLKYGEDKPCPFYNSSFCTR
jgi:hypothetical protein